jgi:hypothetical protein
MKIEIDLGCFTLDFWTLSDLAEWAFSVVRFDFLFSFWR